MQLHKVLKTVQSTFQTKAFLFVYLKASFDSFGIFIMYIVQYRIYCREHLNIGEMYSNESSESA